MTAGAVCAGGGESRLFATNSQKKYRNRKRQPPHLRSENNTKKDEAQHSKQTAPQPKQPPLGLGIKIDARPPGEKEYTPKIPMPDQDKEKEMGRLQNIVMDHHRAGDYRKGLKAAQELFQVTADHFGRDHPATAAAHNNVGLLHKLLGDFIQARASYEAARRIYRRSILGIDHQSYATTLHNLGNLNRHQIHLDEQLSATDRLQLVQDAADYLQQAHAIRLAELGPQHPQTVASRSAWGATLSVQILHQHKLTESSSTTAPKDHVERQRRRSYVSVLPTHLTEQAWDAALEHLQAALETAVQHPRGTTVTKGLEQRAGNSDAKPLSDEIVQAAGPLPTLSAAAAAQNLAVFYKTRATTQTPYHEGWMREAEKLYKQVLIVQAILLHDKHPDMFATKHSLAELLATLGDEETANALRQEMVDTYDPPPATTTAEESDATAMVTVHQYASSAETSRSDDNDDAVEDNENVANLAQEEMESSSESLSEVVPSEKNENVATSG